MGKLLGIIVAVIGIIVLALSFEQARKIVSFTLPSGIRELYLIIAGAVIIILGAILMKGSGSSNSGKEIPIFKGNQIIGYRKV